MRRLRGSCGLSRTSSSRSATPSIRRKRSSVMPERISAWRVASARPAESDQLLAPPDFHGTTFVKQALVETMEDRALLPTSIDKAGFTTAAQPLFAFLDALHPHLWREGKQFPPSQAQLKQMLADGELVMALTFNPNEPANLVASGELPKTTIAWQHRSGTIGNTHFVAIPVNAQAAAAARVTANFLLSPEAQARKADLAMWGDPTVLDMAKLKPEDKALFTGGDAPGAVRFPARTIPEPHGSWVPLIEAAWLDRYGA